MTGADRNAASAALREASAALERGDTTLAESLCRDALGLHPDHATAWMFLGLALRQRDPIAAHAAFTRALELDPSNMIVKTNLDALRQSR